MGTKLLQVQAYVPLTLVSEEPRAGHSGSGWYMSCRLWERCIVTLHRGVVMVLGPWLLDLPFFGIPKTLP
jgi:hypothetical protein